jgi:hypothetical protein
MGTGGRLLILGCLARRGAVPGTHPADLLFGRPDVPVLYPAGVVSMTFTKLGVASRVCAFGCGLLLLSLVVTGTGCGKAETRAKGTVTHGGTTMKNGTIKFHSNPPRDANINADGTYDMQRAPAGKWKVTFFVPENKDAQKTIEPQAALGNKTIQDPKTTPIEVEIKEGVVNNLDIAFPGK